MPPMFVFEDTMGPNGIKISKDDENLPSNFKHKLIKSKLYHFKVIRLKQLEDVIRDYIFCLMTRVEASQERCFHVSP